MNDEVAQILIEFAITGQHERGRKASGAIRACLDKLSREELLSIGAAIDQRLAQLAAERIDAKET